MEVVIHFTAATVTGGSKPWSRKRPGARRRGTRGGHPGRLHAAGKWWRRRWEEPQRRDCRKTTLPVSVVVFTSIGPPIEILHHPPWYSYCCSRPSQTMSVSSS